MAYQDRIALMRHVPHFDPNALKLLSLLAVISRLKSDGDVDVVSRARIYDGEKLEVKRSTSTSSSSSSGPFGGALSTSSGATANHPDYWTVEDFWRLAGDSEAQSGLDMTVMFNMLSEIIDRALKEKKFEGCVSSYEMLTFLRQRIGELEKSDGFTEEQREVLKKCRSQFLAEAPSKGSKPGAIESEYRRLLIRQLYELAAPDFERRAEELYQRYKLHANAFATGDKTVEEPDSERTGRTNRVKVDEVFLDDLDQWIGLKTSTDRSNFRQGLNAQIFKFVRERRVKLNLADDEEYKANGDINWKTLPQLADGIRKKLNSETRVRLERLLKSPLELPDENDDDRRLRAQVFQEFDKLGYCEHCRSQSLEYFKLNELWLPQS
jgi:predicted Ser/Thr protein kinase